MKTLTDVVMQRFIRIDDDQNVQLNEGLSDFVVKHPYMSTVAAGYIISKMAGKPSASEINVVTNHMKFFARTPAERRIQKQLVDTLIQSGSYRLIRTSNQGKTTVWILKRKTP